MYILALFDSSNSVNQHLQAVSLCQAFSGRRLLTEKPFVQSQVTVWNFYKETRLPLVSIPYTQELVEYQVTAETKVGRVAQSV